MFLITAGKHSTRASAVQGPLAVDRSLTVAALILSIQISATFGENLTRYVLMVAALFANPQADGTLGQDLWRCQARLLAVLPAEESIHKPFRGDHLKQARGQCTPFWARSLVGKRSDIKKNSS
jgi:hypothetical protein